jgi:hypothetical protein
MFQAEQECFLQTRNRKGHSYCWAVVEMFQAEQESFLQTTPYTNPQHKGLTSIR